MILDTICHVRRRHNKTVLCGEPTKHAKIGSLQLPNAVPMWSQWVELPSERQGISCAEDFDQCGQLLNWAFFHLPGRFKRREYLFDPLLNSRGGVDQPKFLYARVEFRVYARNRASTLQI